MSSSVLQSNVLFHDPTIVIPNLEIDPSSDSDAQFGILTYTFTQTPVTKKKVYITFTLDQSGSMAIENRMLSTKVTMCNILRYIAKTHTDNGVQVFVHIIGFDTHINILTPGDFVQITDQNLEKWCATVDRELYPRGETDIEQALNYAKTMISKTQSVYPENEYYHLFLTDGEITVGSNNIDVLRKSLNPTIGNIFIGFGKDHNAILLTRLAKSCELSQPMSEEEEDSDAEYDYGVSRSNNNLYRVIETIENAPLVYSDIMFSIMYGAVKRGYIHVVNGQIYNSETSEWLTNISVGTLDAEKTATFYIRSSTPDMIECYLTGDTEYINRHSEKTIEYSAPVPILELDDGTLDRSNMITDCTKDILTYKTMELLTAIQTRNVCIEYEVDKENKKEIKRKIRQLFSIVQSVRKQTVGDDDKARIIAKQYKTLEDDLFIAYKTLDSRLSTMFCAARVTSQIRQCSYNPTDFDRVDDIPIVPCIRRNQGAGLRQPRFVFPKTSNSDDDTEPVIRFNTPFIGSYEQEPDIDLKEESELFKDYETLKSTDTVNRTPTLNGVIKHLTQSS